MRPKSRESPRNMPMATQRASRLIALLRLNLGARWAVSARPCPLNPRERIPANFLEEAEWALGPAQTGMKKRTSLSPHRRSSPELSGP